MKCFVDDTTLNVCPRRRVLDVRPFWRHLLNSGHELADDPAQADRVYLFTCAFNKPQEERSIAAIEDHSVRYGDRLVVAGCLPTIDISKVKQHFTGAVVTNADLSVLPDQPIGDKDIGVCRGCMGNCSYCLDRRAVGPLRSRPLETCVEDLRAGLRNGHRSFRVVGDDLGAWGQDIDSDFITLLEALIMPDANVAVSDYRLHFLEVNANWLVAYQSRLSVLASSKVASLLVGVQSASDRVLRLMNRNYSSGEARQALVTLKQLGKRVGIHLIAGFPTETWPEFEESLQLITSAKVDFGFIFSYSDLGGAPSHHIHPKVVDVAGRLEAAGAFLEKHGYRISTEEAGKLRFALTPRGRNGA
jgi:tRNA A37 methylthiotransferase MiaB